MSELDEKITYIEEQFCDNYCKYPAIIATQHQLDAVCENCPLQGIRKLFEGDFAE